MKLGTNTFIIYHATPATSWICRCHLSFKPSPRLQPTDRRDESLHPPQGHLETNSPIEAIAKVCPVARAEEVVCGNRANPPSIKENEPCYGLTPFSEKPKSRTHFKLLKYFTEKHLCRRKAKVALIIALSNLFIFIASGFADGANTNLEPALALTLTNFIDFVKVPPAINTLIFRRFLYNKPRVFQSLKDETIFLSDQSGKSPKPNTSDLLFALRYQSPNNFMFQQIDSPTNAWSKSTRLENFSGRNEGVWWDLTKTGAVFTDSTNGIYKLYGEDNDTFPIMYRFATEVLHLGMFDLQTDSIQENAANEPRLADEIRFIGRTPYGGTIDGVAMASNGLISEIHYKILNQGGTIQGRTIQITHKDGRLESIQISNIIKDQSVPILYCRYEIVSVSMSTGSNLGGSCSVDQFLADSDREVLIKKTGEMLNLRKGMSPVISHRPNHQRIEMTWLTGNFNGNYTSEP